MFEFRRVLRTEKCLTCSKSCNDSELLKIFITAREPFFFCWKLLKFLLQLRKAFSLSFLAISFRKREKLINFRASFPSAGWSGEKRKKRNCWWIAPRTLQGLYANAERSLSQLKAGRVECLPRFWEYFCMFKRSNFVLSTHRWPIKPESRSLLQPQVFLLWFIEWNVNREVLSSPTINYSKPSTQVVIKTSQPRRT